MEKKKFLDTYSGQSIQELIDLEKEYRIDSIISVIESVLNKKKDDKGKDSFSKEELVILSVEALERNVNHGGYHYFFCTPSNEYGNIIVDSLKTIQCPKTARITEGAIKILGIKDDITVEKMEKVLYEEDDSINERIMDELEEWDNKFHQTKESIETKLFEYIIENKDKITLE